MPLYKDKNCEGACERFSLNCIEPELYVEVAGRYDAEPVEPSGTFQVDGRDVPWSYFTLNVPEERRKDAIRDLAAVLQVRHSTFDEGVIEMTAKAWLKELPCYLECPITICGYCGTQHDQALIDDGTCQVKLSEENDDDDPGDLEDEYVDPRWPKGN